LKTIHELQLVATGARKGELAEGTTAVLETFLASVTWKANVAKLQWLSPRAAACWEWICSKTHGSRLMSWMAALSRSSH